jgi:hypothetical protein
MNTSTQELYIPQHITHLAVNYSIPVIWFSSLVSLYREHYAMAYIQYFVYLTSHAHWYRLSKTGAIRHLDIAVVCSAFLYSVFIFTQYIQEYKAKVWYMVLAVSLTMFVINNFILEYGLAHLSDRIYRERLMYLNTFVHMIFLHYGFSIACIYCVL